MNKNSSYVFASEGKDSRLDFCSRDALFIMGLFKIMILSDIKRDNKSLLASSLFDARHNDECQPDATGSRLKPRFNVHRDDLSQLLDRMSDTLALLAHDRVVSLTDDLDRFATRVSLIGQVKAGKTALTNALIGKPNMLPSDVNPWTSVVTSVHINTAKPKGARAVFTFLTTQEWLDMVEAGGTLGEVANRAGFADEAAQMREQIREMQQRTEQRLGRNFKFLMGGQHTFSGFSPDMVRKYVCLGDENDASAPEGRYADITKTAELYMDSDCYRVPTIVQDTPGVNDPFLMRETVTLNSLGNTDICVLVLCAQQAFSTVDVALLRIVRSFKKQQVIIFVNRIDELDNPQEQIPEIDAYIRSVLLDKDLPTDIPIIFGSADWGEMASFGMNEAIPQASLDKLSKFATKRKDQTVLQTAARHPVGTLEHTNAKKQDLSGLFDLRYLIAEKSRMDNGFPKLADLAHRAQEVVSSSLAFLEQSDVAEWRISDDFDEHSTIASIEATRRKVQGACEAEVQASAKTMLSSISDTYAALFKHEEEVLLSRADVGETLIDWKPDVEALRSKLMATYVQFSNVLPPKIDSILKDAAQDVQSVYNDILDNPVEIFHVEAQRSNSLPKPLWLMKTLPLDMSANWLLSWMPRKVKVASLQRRFSQLVEAEELLVSTEIQEAYIDRFMYETRMMVDSFFEDHIRSLKNLLLLNNKDQHDQALEALGMQDGVKLRLKTLSAISEDLSALIARINVDLQNAEKLPQKVTSRGENPTTFVPLAL